MKSIYRYILLLQLPLLWACTDDNDAPQPHGTPSNDIYITVDMDDLGSRIAYDFAQGEGINSSGNIRAVWQENDIIKVYETDAYGEEGAYSDVYHDYDDYKSHWPYPSAPQVDTYYRFVCVGGVGTTRGTFKYVGLTTATVAEDPVTHIRNINVDIKYNHAIRNWDKFQGLVIYGTPLRNYMMRTQVAKNDLTHLRFGERMYGYMCAHNFQWWFDSGHTQSNDGVGAERLVLKNVGGCVYRVILGGLDVDLYGGSSLSLEMPGVTDVDMGAGIRNKPMSLTLGNSNDFQLGIAPWIKADPDRTNTDDPDYACCAYIVGWPGTLLAGQNAVITLKETVSGKTYTWSLSSPSNITFEESLYYTIDLRNREYTVTQ